MNTVMHCLATATALCNDATKVMGEAPAPQLDPQARQEVLDACVEPEKIGYRGAAPSNFCMKTAAVLIEMNTRVQVEHPVTELVTGTDIVGSFGSLQAWLSRSESDIEVRGHAFECRINAGRSASCHHQAPWTTGTLQAAQRSGRLTVLGLSVPPHYDSLIAKVLTHADTRILRPGSHANRIG